jgi:hypothetical protein
MAMNLVILDVCGVRRGKKKAASVINLAPGLLSVLPLHLLPAVRLAEPLQTSPAPQNTILGPEREYIRDVLKLLTKRKETNTDRSPFRRRALGLESL